MKGRRKIRTTKWEIKAKIEAEAREVFSYKSANRGRFFDVALKRGSKLEPVGWLAGTSESKCS